MTDVRKENVVHLVFCGTYVNDFWISGDAYGGELYFSPAEPNPGHTSPRSPVVGSSQSQFVVGGHYVDCRVALFGSFLHSLPDRAIKNPAW